MTSSRVPPFEKAPVDLEATSIRVGEEEYIVFSYATLREELTTLTTAEAEIANAICEGKSNHGIAQVRGTSVHTVANQVAAILRKAGVGSRLEFIARMQPSTPR